MMWPSSTPSPTPNGCCGLTQRRESWPPDANPPRPGRFIRSYQNYIKSKCLSAIPVCTLLSAWLTWRRLVISMDGAMIKKEVPPAWTESLWASMMKCALTPLRIIQFSSPTRCQRPLPQRIWAKRRKSHQTGQALY